MLSFLDSIGETVSTRSVFNLDASKISKALLDANCEIDPSRSPSGIDANTSTNPNTCAKCNGNLVKTQEYGLVVCEKCGLTVRRVEDEDAIAHEGSSTEQHVTLSDAKCAQEKKTRDDFYKRLKGNKIGIEIDTIEGAINMYLKIQEHYIKRGSIRHSIMCACVQKICESKNMYYKPCEISKIFNITCSDLAEGNKQVNTFLNSGIISLEQAPLDMPAYATNASAEETKAYMIITKYMKLLGCGTPENVDLVFKTVRFLIRYKMFSKSITNTKCIGVMYIIGNTRNNTMKRADIVKHVSIAMHTFTSFADRLIKFMQPLASYNRFERKKCSRLRHLWEKNGIEVPEKAPKI